MLLYEQIMTCDHLEIALENEILVIDPANAQEVSTGRKWTGVKSTYLMAYEPQNTDMQVI